MRQFHKLKEKNVHEKKAREIYGALLRDLGLRPDKSEIYKSELYDAYFPLMANINQIEEESKIPKILMRQPKGFIDNVFCNVEGIPTKISLEGREGILEDKQVKVIEYSIDLDSYLGVSPFHLTPDKIPAPENVKSLLRIYNNYISRLRGLSRPHAPLQEEFVFIDENCPDRVFAEIGHILEKIGNIGKLRSVIKKELEDIVGGEWLGFLYDLQSID